MPTLLLTYANSETHRLATLTKEYDEVHQLLQNRLANGDFTVVSSPFTSIERIMSLIRAHEKKMVLFSFSGHAGRDQLLLEDGEGRAEGIASLLGHCHKLKLVILNGCSTAGQVKLLLEKRIPMVIATSAPVNDYTATQFAITFFTELIQHRKSIREAFERAVNTTQVIGSINEFEITSRGLGTIRSEMPIWGLYFNEERKKLLDHWQVDDRIDIREQIHEFVRTDKLRKALDILKEIPNTSYEANLHLRELTQLETEVRRRIIRRDDALIERARISALILDLAEQVDNVS